MFRFTGFLIGGAALALGGLAGGAQAATYAPGAAVSEDYELGPTDPGKWGSPVFGTGATVTYSFIADGVSCGFSCGGGTFTSLASFMPAGFKDAVVAAFDAWSAVADLVFTEVADDGAAHNAPTASGDIRIGGHVFDGVGGVLAHGYYPPNNGFSAAGDIHFDIAENWKIGFGGPGFDIFQVMAHEIGHAIGLDHSDVPGSLMNAFYTEAFSGPQADDIAGAQYIYGEPVEAAIPVPAALPLLAGGLSVLGLVGWRRRREDA